MEIITLYQLLAMWLSDDPLLEQARTLLMVPDLFNYWFTGVKAVEFSIVTASQCDDPRCGDWAYPLLARLRLPGHIFPEVKQPGTVLGPLLPSVVEEIGLSGGQVVAPACHNTGSAVAAVPIRGDDFFYINSGTWSLIGVEMRALVISEGSLRFHFTNEGGVCGTYRLLKNILGLWLVQQFHRTWQQMGEDLSYAQLTVMEDKASPFSALLDSDCPDLLWPGDMPARFCQFCQRTGQPVPQTKGEAVRCSLEGLALKYRWVLEKLELMLDRELKVIYIMGSGGQNQLLCQLAADATHRLVVTGPIEATAAGEVLMQAIWLGYLGSLAEGCELVRRSFEMREFEPCPGAAWDDAYSRFTDLI